MQQSSSHYNDKQYLPANWENPDNTPAPILMCNWQRLRDQLLEQWPLLTPIELHIAGAHCGRIASLISRKYGIAHDLVENYLRNFERTMPLL